MPSSGDRVNAGPGAAGAPTVRVIEIDRWGRFLVAEEADGRWRLPASPVGDGESPDLAAVRAFEALTGEVLDGLMLYRAARSGETPWAPGATAHVYYFDADLDPAILGDGMRAFHRVAPGDVEAAPLDEQDRSLLAEFAAGTHYRAMFH